MKRQTKKPNEESIRGPCFSCNYGRGCEESLEEDEERRKMDKRYREGRVVRWERKARVSCIHCRTNKENLQSW